MILRGWLSWIFLLACCFSLAGCAGKLPRTDPVDDSEKQQILSRFQDLRNQTCDTSIDADVTLELITLGNSEKASGILQVQAPSFLRYTATDPLGRSLLLLVTDGKTFTLANNREGEGYTGSTDAELFKKYVPASVRPEEVFPWLAGRVSPNSLRFEQVGRDRELINAVWLQAEGPDASSHHILFDHETERILRHLVTDNSRNILLDVRYENYVRKKSRCPWPMKITIESKDLAGTLTVHYQQAFFNSPLNPKLFQIELPPHFKIKTVE